VCFFKVADLFVNLAIHPMLSAQGDRDLHNMTEWGKSSCCKRWRLVGRLWGLCMDFNSMCSI